MTSLAIAVNGWGANTAVGLSAPAAAAAMRAGINSFQKTTYRSLHGEPIIGAPVPNIEASGLGLPYLAALAAPPLAECFAALPRSGDRRTKIFFGTEPLSSEVNLPELSRKLGETLLKCSRLAELGIEDALSCLTIVPFGEMAFVHGLLEASENLNRGEIDFAIVGGAETYLRARRLRQLEEQGRLKTGRNSDGVIPGEGGAFVLISRIEIAGARALKAFATICSASIRQEESVAQSSPNRGEALTHVISETIGIGRSRYDEIGFRPTNLSGERLVALEEGIAVMRCFLEPMSLPPAWYASASVGTIGAGVGALLAGWAAAAFDRRYAPGAAGLCEICADDGGRAAFLVRAGHATATI